MNMLISNLQSVTVLVGKVYRQEYDVEKFSLDDEKENSGIILILHPKVVIIQNRLYGITKELSSFFSKVKFQHLDLFVHFLVVSL